MILDADDPMVEIHGSVVWQEEHDRVVEETRQQAFAEGYDAGQRDAPPAQSQQPLRVELRRRRTVLERLRLLILIVGLLIVLLMLPLVIQNALR